MAQTARHEAEKAEDTAKHVSNGATDTAKEVTDKATSAAREAASKAAEVVKNGAEKSVELSRDLLNAGAQSATAFRNDLQKRVGAAGEVQRETLRKAAEGTAELGKLYTDLLKEQAEHNQQVAKAFGKAFNWNEAVRVQSEFVRASFERMSQLNSRYVEIVQAVMTSAVSTAKDQAKKAA